MAPVVGEYMGCRPGVVKKGKTIANGLPVSGAPAKMSLIFKHSRDAGLGVGERRTMQNARRAGFVILSRAKGSSREQIWGGATFDKPTGRS